MAGRMSSIQLRRIKPADTETLLDWRSEAGTRAHQPIVQLPIDDLRAAISARTHLLMNPAAFGNFQFMVEVDHRPVGWITLDISESNRRHGNAEIGYTIGAEFRGHGYGRSALAALIPIAFDRLQFNLERLSAVASIDNIASCRVLESNGFTREGTLRGLLIINGRRVDHATFGLLRSDWERE